MFFPRSNFSDLEIVRCVNCRGAVVDNKMIFISLKDVNGCLQYNPSAVVCI